MTRDIVLLNHEFLESVLEMEGLLSYEAHETAEEIYNYRLMIESGDRSVWVGKITGRN